MTSTTLLLCSASVAVERSRSIVDIAKGDTFVCKYFRPPPALFEKNRLLSIFAKKSCKIEILVIFGLLEPSVQDLLFSFDMNCNSITFLKPFK